MTKPNVSLADTRLSVAPGGRVTTILTIRPAAQVVGQYRIWIPSHCPASRWVSFRFASDTSGRSSPSAKVSFLRAGKTVELEVAFEPPAALSTPSGISPYIIAIDAQEPQNESTTIEGALQIGGQPAIVSKLFEKTSKGRRKGHFRIGVANSGNTPTRVKLSADHDPGAVAVAWAPDELALAPKGSSEFLVEMMARNIQPTGKAQTHTADFTPRVSTPSGDLPGTSTHTATFEQKPMIPTIAVPFLAMAVAAGGFLAYRNLPQGSQLADVDPTLPNAPTELAATVDLDSARVSWLNDPRATGVEVVYIDCEFAEGLEVGNRISTEELTQNEQFVDFALDENTPDQLCFRARSIGSDGGVSAWTESIQQSKADSTVPVPQNLVIQGDELIFDMVQGATGYELIVNNNAVDDVYEASPINLRDLDLQSGDKLAVRALVDERNSAASEVALYSSSNQPLFDRPWVLFTRGSSEIDPSTRVAGRAAVGKLAAPYNDRRLEVDIFQLPTETVQGGSFTTPESEGSLDIGGLWVVADPGNVPLTEAEAISYCRNFFESIPDPGGLTCTPYGSNGQPLAIPGGG